jgi:flagellar biosynthesis anti-sigma factor FlgM
MRTDRKARRTRAATNRKGEYAGPQTAAGATSEPNQFSSEQDSADHYSADSCLADDGSADRARANRLAALAVSPPEIRSERIAAIQSAIANGTYQVSPEQTAEAILSEQQVRDETAA